MFEQIRDKMREKIRSLEYVMTIHAEEEMICDVCGKSGARTIYVTRSYGREESLLVIENVPVVSCPHCGESYLTAKTLREIERIKRNRSDIAVERAVPVAVFA